MVTKDEEVFDAFVRIWSAWWSGIPTDLARQEPSMVARLLILGSREGGISQSDIQQELQINQPRLSKLMRKLLKVGWIRVKGSKTDRRIRLMTTTVTARDWIATLQQDLESLLRAQGTEQVSAAVAQFKRPTSSRRDKPIREQSGQTQFDLVE